MAQAPMNMMSNPGCVVGDIPHTLDSKFHDNLQEEDLFNEVMNNK